MDRRAIGAIAAAGVLILAVGVWALSRRLNQPDTSEASPLTTKETTTSTSINTTTSATAVPLFIIGSWEDKLAVFTPPVTTPDQVYEVYISSLPEEEQQRLRQGIEVYDEKMLNSLLEDYTS
ncbi:MAG TPA: hypothetical protein DEP23_06765 [Ruminococcaceae bacterium]|nr:hypothetical protein [Oscillospiraceae bacterium]